jgi:hypothetical protein
LTRSGSVDKHERDAQIVGVRHFEETMMKTAVAAVALVLFGAVPVWACEYQDKSAASPIDEMAAASTPAASKVPAQNVAKAPVQNAAKPAVVKVKQATNQKVADSATN